MQAARQGLDQQLRKERAEQADDQQQILAAAVQVAGAAVAACRAATKLPCFGL